MFKISFWLFLFIRYISVGGSSEGTRIYVVGIISEEDEAPPVNYVECGGKTKTSLRYTCNIVTPSVSDGSVGDSEVSLEFIEREENENEVSTPFGDIILEVESICQLALVLHEGETSAGRTGVVFRSRLTCAIFFIYPRYLSKKAYGSSAQSPTLCQFAEDFFGE